MPMRLPKGFGSIVKLSGKRRNPYMVRPATHAYSADGSPLRPKPIGYYKTYPEAMAALTQYNRNPYSVENITFEEMFERMIDDKVKGKGVSAGTESTYFSAFKRLAPLHQRTFHELRLAELQAVVDSTGKSKSSVSLEVAVIKQMYGYAMKYELVDKNYSEFLVARSGEDAEKGVPFSDEELDALKAMEGDEMAQAILCLCYTGFRISAYKTIENHDNEYLKGGVKTKQSKGRTVPIHPAIKPWIHKVVGMDGDAFRRRFDIFMQKHGMSHTPHDCRHTFSYLCDKYGVDPFTKRLLMGHTLGTDVSDLRYGHRSYEQLQEAINKLVF